MGRFSQGLLVGIGIGILVAPQPGAEMRRLLSERIQKLRQSLPESDEIKQSAQVIKDQASQSIGTAKDNVVQISGQVKEKLQGSGGAVSQGMVAMKTGSKERIDAITQKVGQKNQLSEPALAAGSPVGAATTNTESVTPPVGVTELLTRSDALRTIPGMEVESRSHLEAEGIHTTQQLLERTGTKEKRVELAQKVGVSTQVLRTFIERADLMRIGGIGYDEVSLLEEAGVNGCKDLQHRNPEHLHATLIDLQENSKSATATVSLDEVNQWIAEAMAITSGTKR